MIGTWTPAAVIFAIASLTSFSRSSRLTSLGLCSTGIWTPPRSIIDVTTLSGWSLGSVTLASSGYIVFPVRAFVCAFMNARSSSMESPANFMA